MFCFDDTIVASATATGGALSVIRISGESAIEIADYVFRGKTPLCELDGGQFEYGQIVDGERIIDDVIASLFRAPHSYTGKNTVEFSCHGSSYIVSEIVRLLVRSGARPANAGEFTQQAFLSGKMAISQAEAVADLIASHDRASHSLARSQMRGGYSSKLANLRAEMVHLGALLELELDFGEEDIEFADREKLTAATGAILSEIKHLISSFTIGNAIKNGIPVAIVGAPNVGKSTLLNTIVCDERAIVSNVAGTTRDVVEERIVIGDIEFRFYDTAGVHETADTVEVMGIARTRLAAERALFVLLVIDAAAPVMPTIELNETQHVALVVNKSDIRKSDNLQSILDSYLHSTDIQLNTPVFHISALTGDGVEALTEWLAITVAANTSYSGATIVSSARHTEALQHSANALATLIDAIADNSPSDILAEHLNIALHYIGEITGEITSAELLHTIFSKFCIGK